MKKILWVFIIAFLATSSWAQEKEVNNNKSNYFYVGPVDLVFNTLELGYERSLCNHNSIVIFGGLKLSKKDDLINRFGGNGELQYRINLLYNKESVSGIVKRYSTFAYFAPFFQYRYEQIIDVNVSDSEVPDQTHSFVNSGFAGLGFGFRLAALENRFCLNAFAGGGMKYSDVSGLKKYTDFFEVGYTGIAPKLGLQLGIKF